MSKSSQCRLFRVNAFTRERSGGNPAGVVLGADGLSDRQMRECATAIGVPDTAFVLQPKSPDHDLWVRFLTPRHETTFVGHATIAAQYVLAKVAGQTRLKRRQLTGIGILEIEILEVEGDYRVAITQKAPALGPLFPDHHKKDVLGALGLPDAGLHPNYPLRLMAEKAPRLFIGVRSPEVLSSLAPDFERLKHLSPQVGAEGYFVFALGPRDAMASTQSRLFCPAMGIPEDPVSGNTHAMLGVYLTHYGLLKPKDGKASFCGHQGAWVGRPGVVHVEVDCKDRNAQSVRILGDAVVVEEVPLPASLRS